GVRDFRPSDSVPRVYAAGERAEDAVVLAPPEPLTLEALGRIAAGAAVVLGDRVRSRLEASHAQLVALARSGRTVYGLNTGCGPLCDRRVSPEASSRFQRNLVRSHATGLGLQHPTEVVRATMAVRAFSLSQGRSAVRPLVVDTLVAMLNAGVHPVIPEIGSVGASGDLVELAHVASALMGEGKVEWRATGYGAGQALAGSRRLRDATARAGRPVQDAYTVRCVPQVLGAVRDALAHARRTVAIELNSVTDNPTFFPEDGAVDHAGNFHGQPIALAMDHL